jgi:hypothetical protein
MRLYAENKRARIRGSGPNRRPIRHRYPKFYWEQERQLRIDRMRQVDPELGLGPYNSVLFFLESRRSKSYGSRECRVWGTPVSVSDVLEAAHEMVVREEYGDGDAYERSRDRRPATIVWKNVRYTYNDGICSSDDGYTDEEDDYIDDDGDQSEYSDSEEVGDSDSDGYGTSELTLKLTDGDCILIE